MVGGLAASLALAGVHAFAGMLDTDGGVGDLRARLITARTTRDIPGGPEHQSTECGGGNGLLELRLRHECSSKIDWDESGKN